MAMSDYSMTIGGRPVATPASFSVQNPATADDLAAAPECAREQLDLAMGAGQEAQPGQVVHVRERG
jgi:acyl-CoA reductase-like NAD-dependent aldehyde dehydrogenase